MNKDDLDLLACERWSLVAEHRTGVTCCPACLMPALEVHPTRNGSFHCGCRACDFNGFVHRADLVFALLGCGAFVRGLDLSSLVKLHARLASLGTAPTAPAQWTEGAYGRGGKTVRPVLRAALSCMACPSSQASARRDVLGKPYIVDRGCKSRFFLPSDAALRRVVGWSELRRTMRTDPWPDWFRTGREVWAGWHALDPVSADQGEDADMGHHTKEVRHGLEG